MRSLLIVFLFCFSVSFAQKTSGYMGKRLTIAYSCHLLPALSATSKGTNGGLNNSHSMSFEYITARTKMLCLSFRYFKSGIQVSGLSPAVYMPSNKLPMQLNSFNIGLGYKFFFRGFPAPVGKYVKPELLFLINNVKYQKNGFRQPSATGGLEYVTIGSGSHQSVNFGITYQIGSQRVIKDKIVLDGGLRLGVILNGALQNVGAFAFDYSNTSRGIGNIITNEVNNRVFLHELFSFHVGIGFLAF